MEFLWFLLIGLAAGWLAGQLTKGGGYGVVGDLIVGVIGALLGGFLFGLLFFVPFFGLAVGAAMGALIGHFSNYGIDQSFIEQVRAKVTPGTSALFLLSSGAVTDRVAEAVKGQQFEIIQTNLSQEQEDKLRADFGDQ